MIILFFPISAFSQQIFSDSLLSTSNKYVSISSIEITGNKHTKPYIILRELGFISGDSILSSELDQQLEKAQNRIFNLGLFLSANISKEENNTNEIKISITVSERIRTYIIPLLGLADRNFSEWWNTRNHDLSRLDWGVRFIQKNVRGRNETFRMRLELGFNKKLEMDYTIPYINKNLKTGLSIAVGAIYNRQVAYITENQKLMYTEDAAFTRTRYTAGLTLFRRNNFYQTHYLSLFYYANTITDTIAKLNSRYFLDGRTSQQYPSIKYAFVSDHRDLQFYALHGYYCRIDLENHGAFLSPDINFSFAKIEISGFKPLGKKIFLATTLKGKTSTPSEQPFYNQRGLGYDKEFISGYELYVIDGQHYAYYKLNVKYELLKINSFTNKQAAKHLKKIPFAIYFKIYGDAGYVSNKFQPGNERLANKGLYGYGLGFDFVTYYDFVLRTEYSINGENEGGFYLNFKAAI